MTESDRHRVPSYPTPEDTTSGSISRRRLLQLGAMTAPLPLILAACGGGGKQSAGTQAEGVNELVGQASGEDALVALVVLEGVDPDHKEVIGYICNGKTNFAESFRGLASGNQVDLASDDGNAHLKATLTQNGATGTVELPGGGTVTFETKTAAGDNPAGLYDIALYPDGTALGTSWDNKRLVTTVSENAIRGTVALPDGDSVPFKLVAGHPQITHESGEFRVVVLPDSTLRGSRTKVTGSTSSGYAILLSCE